MFLLRGFPLVQPCTLQGVYTVQAVQGSVAHPNGGTQLTGARGDNTQFGRNRKSNQQYMNTTQDNYVKMYKGDGLFV